MMKSTAQLHSRHLPQLRGALLGWYDQNRRDLPWRKTRDPYRVWISEIMLQQTRVAAVIPRYEEFLRRFPSVQKLAAARESSVLAEWSGLGYYRRARNLHAAAKIIAREKIFPQNAEAWRALPGIGRYTATAIASIAFNEPVAVFDGNVERVLQRVLGGPLADQKLWDTAQSLLDRERPGDFNQAMMELGATLCLPRQPQCAGCPIIKFCRTRGAGQPTTPKTRQRKREITYSLTRRPGSILLVRRSQNQSLMPGMWELPEVAAPNAADEPLFSVRHSITVTNFRVRVVARGPANGRWVRISRLNTLPLTGLAKKILRTAGIIQ
jgi:A/G-specific adenine glycosylase